MPTKSAVLSKSQNSVGARWAHVDRRMAIMVGDQAPVIDEVGIPVDRDRTFRFVMKRVGASQR